MMRLFGQAGLGELFGLHQTSGSGFPNVDNDDDDLEYGYGGPGTRRKQRSKSTKARFPLVPSENGKILMNTGTFGENEYYKDVLRKRKSRLGIRLMNRELGIGKFSSTKANRLISQVQMIFFPFQGSFS